MLLRAPMFFFFAYLLVTVSPFAHAAEPEFCFAHFEALFRAPHAHPDILLKVLAQGRDMGVPKAWATLQLARMHRAGVKLIGPGEPDLEALLRSYTDNEEMIKYVLENPSQLGGFALTPDKNHPHQADLPTQIYINDKVDPEHTSPWLALIHESMHVRLKPFMAKIAQRRDLYLSGEENASVRDMLEEIVTYRSQTRRNVPTSFFVGYVYEGHVDLYGRAAAENYLRFVYLAGKARGVPAQRIRVMDLLSTAARLRADEAKSLYDETEYEAFAAKNRRPPVLKP